MKNSFMFCFLVVLGFALLKGGFTIHHKVEHNIKKEDGEMLIFLKKFLRR